MDDIVHQTDSQRVIRSAIFHSRRNSGDDHVRAVELPAEATRPAKKAANSLKRLLTEKTPIQYGVHPV